MKAYKGFNKDMTCRGFQYEEGKTYKTDKAEICEAGFHACEDPLDCFGYYAPGQSVYHEVEIEDNGQRNTDDTKVVGKKIKIGAKIGVPQIAQLHIEYVKSKIEDTKTNTGDYSAATNTGDRSAATNTGNYSAATNTGYYSAATNTGDRSAATNTGSYSAATNTGYCSTATVEGKNSVAIATGYKSKVKSTVIGSAIVVVERDDNYNLVAIQSAIVDGVTIKVDTWYTCENGKLVEVKDDEM